MAPERFDGRSDRRSDVYGLGVTLYELLTLRPAFPATDAARSSSSRSCTGGRRRPRHHDRRIPRDLETIVLKAMAKEPADRYATADAMAEDLGRFLERRPLRWARRVGPLERAWRWCRRNPVVAGLLTAVAALLVASAAGATHSNWRLSTVLRQLRLAQDETREQLRGSLLAQARALRRSDQPGHRQDALDALARAAGIRPGADLRDEAIACLAADGPVTGSATGTRVRLPGRTSPWRSIPRWSVMPRSTPRGIRSCATRPTTGSARSCRA